MFIPPFPAIEKVLGEALARSNPGDVVVPARLFRFIMRCLLAISEFDEERYLAAYPEVAAAVRAGQVPSGFAHFVNVGYFAGFTGGIEFDEGWYLDQYPDVARAVQSGATPSGRQHYFSDGVMEWRAPNAKALHELSAWHKVIEL